MTDPTHGAHAVTPESEGAASGLVYIRNGVEFYLKEKKLPIEVAPVGLKYRAFNLNQNKPGGANRIVFIPGDFDPNAPAPKSRKYGDIDRATRNNGSGRNPRELASWNRLFTVSVWAGPTPGKNNDEGENLSQAERLLEILIRALYSVGSPEGPAVAASLRFGEVLVNAPPTDNAFGAELLVKMVQITPFYDEAYEVVQAKLKTTATVT